MDRQSLKLLILTAKDTYLYLYIIYIVSCTNTVSLIPKQKLCVGDRGRESKYLGEEKKYQL